MRQEALAERLHPSETVVGPHRRPDHVGLEHLLGGGDGGELQLLLGPEVRIEAALAHAARMGEASDRKPVDALDGRQAGGSREDRPSAALAVGAPATPADVPALSAAAGDMFVAVRHRTDKIARPIVL